MIGMCDPNDPIFPVVDYHTSTTMTRAGCRLRDTMTVIVVIIISDYDVTSQIERMDRGTEKTRARDSCGVIKPPDRIYLTLVLH